jgi:hypothetical protein
MVKKRSSWFDEFIDSNLSPAREDILDFHHFTGDGDKANDLVMAREGLSTVSITCIDIKSDVLDMEYLELPGNQRFSEQIRFDSSMAGK